MADDKKPDTTPDETGDTLHGANAPAESKHKHEGDTPTQELPELETNDNESEK